MELLFPVEGPLSSSLTASILEAGFTYVLYQRGQIPMPYQQLQVSAMQHKVQVEKEQSMVNDSRQQNHENFKPNGSVPNFNETSTLNARDRISTMLVERKKRLLASKLEKLNRQALAVESKAFNAIQPALEVLQRLLTDVTLRNLGVTSSGQPKRVLSMALVLGPSVYCPKEMYSFDLPYPWVSDDATQMSKVAAEKFRSDIVRQFYKKIITNTDLMDFTSKPLPKTYAHICLVTFGDLNSLIHGNSDYKEVIRLPKLPPSILQTLLNTESCQSTDESSFQDTMENPRPYSNFRTSRKQAKSKIFKIKIHYSNYESEESIDLTQCLSTTNSFSGDILFDNNSFSCYQIPLRFKGVQCKNKRS